MPPQQVTRCAVCGKKGLCESCDTPIERCFTYKPVRCIDEGCSTKQFIVIRCDMYQEGSGKW